MRTFIRRPGNKTNFLKHIIPRIPDFPGTYFEPFVGTGAVYLALLPKKAILNDLNKDVASVWKLVKNNPEYLLREISEFKKTFLPLDSEEKLKVCKEILSNLKNLKGDEKAAMFLLMTYCSFTGVLEIGNNYKIYSLARSLYSENSLHIFTEKFQEKIRGLSKILQKVKVYSKDYSDVISKAKEGDFVFLDPPYIEERKYRFNYIKNEEIFSNSKLLKQLDALTSRKAKWMMTQADTLEVRTLFKKYNFFEYENSNTFSSKSVKKELIITNYSV
jgi:DNA adenine methylase